jgi:hypothetical protein
MTDSNFFNEISDAIDEVFGRFPKKEKTKKKPMNTDNEAKIDIVATPGSLQFVLTDVDESVQYESIDEYKQRTGKRFRMLKEQKERGLTREQAFAEFIVNNSDA